MTATHWTSRHVWLSQRKSLRNEQIDARTVASRCEKRTSGHGGSCLGGAESEQVTAGVRHWWADVRDRRATAYRADSQEGEDMATEQITVEQQVDKGLKSGALGLVSTTIIATASVAPTYSIAATLVFVVGAVALQSPRGGRPRVRADAADIDRLQRAEQGRPGLRHHVHVGHARVRPEDGMGGRLGDHRRRRAGHGEPGPGRGPVRVPAVQRRGHRDQRRPAAGCCWSACCGSW